MSEHTELEDICCECVAANAYMSFFTYRENVKNPLITSYRAKTCLRKEKSEIRMLSKT